MEYSKIVSVSGLPGLYELINSKQDGAIIRSLDDKATKFASSRIHNFSHLESIEVYTTRENVNLVEIFLAMEKTGDSLPDTKDQATVRKYFEKVYPDMDFERVYGSDLKKMIKWFETLQKNQIEIKLSEPEPEETEKIEDEKEPENMTKAKETPKAAAAGPVKKSAKKKTEEKTEKKSAASKESKPAKKTAKKKGK